MIKTCTTFYQRVASAIEKDGVDLVKVQINDNYILGMYHSDKDDPVQHHTGHDSYYSVKFPAI